jgi:hypothetical protein
LVAGLQPGTKPDIRAHFEQSRSGILPLRTGGPRIKQHRNFTPVKLLETMTAPSESLDFR